NNAGNITQFFNQHQGRLDARRVSFPFEAIARNVGIGTEADSQSSAPAGSSASYLLAGLQVHVLDLNTPDYAHLMAGHVGPSRFSIEGKNNRDGVSTSAIWGRSSFRTRAPICASSAMPAGTSLRTGRNRIRTRGCSRITGCCLPARVSCLE